MLIPSIKVLDLLSLSTPLKVRVTGDSVTYWECVKCIPTLCVAPRALAAVSVSSCAFHDRFASYVFSQAFYNIYMYNELRLNDPLRYFVDDTTCSFYYFMTAGEVLTIPLLYNHPGLSVTLTLHMDRPALKLSFPNPKR